MVRVGNVLPYPPIHEVPAVELKPFVDLYKHVPPINTTLASSGLTVTSISYPPCTTMGSTPTRSPPGKSGILPERFVQAAPALMSNLKRSASGFISPLF